MQKAEKNEEIEKVGSVFKDYITNSSHLEWFWSEKLGYVLLQIYAKTQDIQDGRPIHDAEELCRILAGEIAQEVLYETGKDRDTYEADQEDRARIRERLKLYREQLLEYRPVFDRLTE